MVDFFHNEGLLLTFTSLQRYDIYGDAYHMKVFGRGGGRATFFVGGGGGCAALIMVSFLLS